ncbi:hypothetical protein ACQCNZ_11330 [Proteus mirabilis]
MHLKTGTLGQHIALISAGVMTYQTRYRHLHFRHLRHHTQR